MSDYEHEREQRQEADATQARVGRAKWSPWVWVVPAVAIVIAGWLVVRYGFFGGGDVTVRFVEARGLDRYSPVRFRGAKVGTVQKITIDEDLQEVVVRITMDASMSHALKANTRFWIVEPGLEGGGLGGLLSGTYVAIAPGDGDDTREFVGQEYPPVLAAPEAGKTFILEGAGAGAIAIGAPVQHEGIRVGRVLGTAYDPQRGISSVHVFVVQRFADRVRQSTRFYRAGGLTISFAGGGLSVGDASLSSLITAGIAFYTPEVLAGAQVANGTRFELYGSRAVAESSADGPHLTYLTYFPGPIHGLAPGTPVQMKGVQVGRVRDVRLRYVQARGVLETPVMLEIDPRQLEFAVTPSTTRADLRRMMNDALARLVQRGLRARLSSSLVLPGASSVSLDVIAAPGTARLVLENDPPIIPASGAGAGIEGALASLNEIAGTIQSLPLREIAGDIRSAASRVNALVSDPRLESSLQRLNTSLAEIERVATITGQNIGPLAQSLRNAATSAEEAAKRVEELIGTSQRQNYDVAELIKELTRAAEAVRALATYLTENPDAVLKGRRE
jgi:paraquat-inducible protein B